MRHKRLFLVLLLALASGAVAGYSILQYLRQRPTPLIASEPRNESVSVVVAARDIALGQKLTEDDVKRVDWPASAIPEGYSTSVPAVVDRGVITPIRANVPILDADLADPGLGAGLAPAVPEGMRAVSVPVNEVVQVAGWALPGTRVDIILIGDQGGPLSKVILQNVPVRGVAQTIQEDEEGQAHVVSVATVILSPEDSEKLALASTQGQIRMALRNPLDIETVETRGERVSGVFSGASPRARSTVRKGTSPAAPAQGI
ncbi:MAG TPA: Flp pilus assembly protein CpaB, partial [Longimicrobiales bacterium]|nr:Flp pilus assembly protein CpaB [Longimicrobiales bacterium]